MKLCKSIKQEIVRADSRTAFARARLTFVVAGLMLSALLLEAAGNVTLLEAAGCPKDSCNTACTSSYYWASGYHWYESDMPIEYYMNKNGAANCIGDEFRAVQEAAKNWEDMHGTFWATCYGDTTSKHSSAHNWNPNVRDSVNVVSWEDLGGVSPLTFATAYVWYSGDRILEGDVSFNDNAAVKWSALSVDSCLSGKYDLENIATHEFGHWLYLSHSCDTSATMYCYADSNETQKRTLEACELLGMQYKYTQYPGQPKPQPGCWPVAVGADVYSNPVLGDINRDGVEEIVVAGVDGKVHVYTGRGKELSGWPQNAGDLVNGSPALGDVQGDGWLEIVVGSNNDSIYVFAHNGARIAAVGTDSYVKNTPAIGDLDKDGFPDIVCASEDSHVYAFRANGNAIPGWPRTLGGAMEFGGPALADLDGDDSLEVVISGYDNKVYAIKPHGADLAGWPVSTGRNVHERAAIGDIDGDDGLEVIATSEHDSLYAWNSNGGRCSGWPVYVPKWIENAAPSLGDIDGDGSPEILFGCESDSVYAFEGSGARVTGWPRYVDGAVMGSVLIVDIDGDDGYEVIASTDTGKIYAFNGNGTAVTGWPKTYGGTGYQRSPAIGDTNNDDELDIIVGSTDPDNLYAFNLGTTIRDDTYEWRMYGHDWNRASRFGFAPAAPIPVLFIDQVFSLDRWERWGFGAANVNLSTMSFSPPYSMGVSGSPVSGEYAKAYSELITLDFSRPYTVRFYFAFSNFYSATWLVFGHARFRLASPGAPVLLDCAGDWSVLVPIGPPFGSYCPPGVFTECEVRVDPEIRSVALYINGGFMGSAEYFSSVVPSNRIWLEDGPETGRYLTGWYDDFEVRGYLPVLGVDPGTTPVPPLVNVLYQSYPNPMNPCATIKYSVRETGRVTLRIYDVAGRVIRILVDEEKLVSAVPYSVLWNGKDDSGRQVASGVYFCYMETRGFASAKKIVVLR